MTIPTGKGYFVWQLARCAGGDPLRLAQRARDAGLGWVAFKTHNGTSDRNGDLAPHAAALRAAGVEPWGWGYIYGASPVLEATKAVQRGQAAGLAGYFINAEHEFKAPGMTARADTFVRTMRTLAPDLSLGLCSYRYPSYHPEFPWAAFLAGCDFHAPQVYWLEDNDPQAPAEQLERSVRELRARRDLPFVPLGAASPNDAGTWLPTVAQLNNFDQAAHALGLPAAGWWAWDHAEKHPGWWATIAAHQWGTETPPVTPESEAHLQYLLTTYDFVPAQRILDKLGGDAVQLQAILPIPISPTQPPPIINPFPTQMTNQDVINLFDRAFGRLPKENPLYIQKLTAATDEAKLVANRGVIYDGPPIAEMPGLSPADKELLLNALAVL